MVMSTGMEKKSEQLTITLSWCKIGKTIPDHNERSAVSIILSVYRRRAHQGECGGHHRPTVDRRRGRSRGRLQQTEAPLLHQSNNRAGTQGPVGSRHGDVRVLVLGRVHPAGQADLQAVWRPLHPHLVRHHLELPLLPPLLHRPPVQESREADAQTEIQVRRLSLHPKQASKQCL